MTFGVFGRRARLFLALAISIGAAGCATKRAAQRVAGAENRIRKVKVEGNRALKDEEIRRYLHLQPTKWFPLPKKRYFFEGYVPVDTKRVEDLYHARGRYEARVLDVKVDRHPKREIVDITFVVDEGAPTIIQAVDFDWPEGPPTGPHDRRATPPRIQQYAKLQVGAAFDLEDLHDAEATMRAALQMRGYAFAEVEATADVDRTARTARVRFAIRPGRWVKIGEIRFEGLQKIPEKVVAVEVEEFKDKPFSPRRIENIEQAVYGLEVFSTVTIEHAEAPRGQYVDLTVRVVEDHPQMIKLGLGIGVERNRWEQFGEMRYRHQNAFRNLTRFELRLRAGYAELPALYNPREHGPIIDFEPSLRKKGMLEKKLVWTLQPRFELGIWEGYQFYAPGNRMGVSRFFTRFVEIGLTHNLRYVDFFRIAPTLDASRSILGLDFRDPYLLSFMQLQARLYLTDRLLDPQNGVVLGAAYDISGRYLGSQFDYQKITPEVRGYWTPIRNRLQFAIRGQTGVILPYGKNPGAPFDLKYYLGGTASVRGWGLRRLAPFVDTCVEGTECRRIPVGGNTMVMGNFETRVRVWRDLWTVAFIDMGDVRPGRFDYRPNAWSYSAGPGLRYRSRIGTFRLDVGFRLNKVAPWQNEPIWALHFGLGEAF